MRDLSQSRGERDATRYPDGATVRTVAGVINPGHHTRKGFFFALRRSARDGIADLLASNSAGELYFYAGTGLAATPFKERVKIGTGGWNQYADLV